MKKYLAIMLALCMVLSLCACGSEPSAPANEPAQAAVEEPAAEAPAEAAPAEEPAVEESAEILAQQAIENEDESFALGTIDGNSYINEFFGIACEFDSAWEVLDRAGLDEMSGLTSELIPEGKYRELLENSNVIYDLYASADGGLNTVNGNITKLNPIQALLIDEDAMVDQSMSMIPDLLSQQGLTVTSCEKVTVTLAGLEHPGILVVADYSGFAFYELITVIQSGSFYYCLTSASLMEDNTGAIFEMFTAA